MKRQGQLADFGVKRFRSENGEESLETSTGSTGTQASAAATEAPPCPCGAIDESGLSNLTVLMTWD